MPASKFSSAHKKLSQLRSKAAKDLQQKHAKALTYLQEKKLLLPGVIERSKKIAAGASLVGSLLLSPAKAAETPGLSKRPVEERVKQGLASAEEVRNVLKERLPQFLPEEIGKLSDEQSQKICQSIEDILGIKVCTELEGFQINYDYAWTGYEQHLYRFPGDDLEQHDDEKIAGIAPGLGAWGHFADSKEELSKEDIEKEKYYMVVQTLYFPDWNARSTEIYDWFKHRKVIMINPENGTAVVGSIADAGPAQWTGKQFGASPEAMKALDLHDEWRKGKVLLLFVDDPENKVPLGPIDYNLKEGKPLEV